MSLITNSAPVIIAQPQSVAVNPGSNATFSVSAIGGTPLYYKWLFNATNILRYSTNYTAATNYTNILAVKYTLVNAGTNNAGNYSVVITNQVGA